MAHVTRARTNGARLDEAGTSGGAARSAADGGAAHDRRAHGGRADGGRSVGALVKQGTEQLSELMRQELRLAQAELTRKGKQAGFGGGLFGGAGLMAFFGLACLITAAIAGIAGPLTVWAAALIVAGGLMLLAAILAFAGRKEMKRAAPPVPGEAVDSLRTDLETMKERATKHDSR